MKIKPTKTNRFFFKNGQGNRGGGEPRAAGSSAAAPAACADRGGADGLGRLYLKATPGRCPARVRPEVGSFFYSTRKKNKKKY